MHRHRASGVEDHRTGNLNPREGSALPRYVRHKVVVGSNPTSDTVRQAMTQHYSRMPVHEEMSIRVVRLGLALE